MSVTGEPLRSRELTPLPWALGEYETLAWERLPSEPRDAWQVASEFRISESSGMLRSYGGASRTATDHTDYRIASIQGDTVWIEKQYRMTSGQEASNLMHLTITGQGRVSFDRRKGLVTSLTMNYTIESQKNGRRETTQANIDCRTMDPGRFQQLVAESRQRLREEEEALAAGEREASAENRRTGEASENSSASTGGLRSAGAETNPADLQPGSPVRTWTDATGKFQVEAELVGVSGQTVKLKRTDGKVLDVPLARLRRADQDYVRTQTAASGDAAAA